MLADELEGDSHHLVIQVHVIRAKRYKNLTCDFDLQGMHVHLVFFVDGLQQVLVR